MRGGWGLALQVAGALEQGTEEMMSELQSLSAVLSQVTVHSTPRQRVRLVPCAGFVRRSNALKCARGPGDRRRK